MNEQMNGIQLFRTNFISDVVCAKALFNIRMNGLMLSLTL